MTASREIRSSFMYIPSRRPFPTSHRLTAHSEQWSSSTEEVHLNRLGKTATRSVAYPAGPDAHFGWSREASRDPLFQRSSA